MVGEQKYGAGKCALPLLFSFYINEVIDRVLVLSYGFTFGIVEADILYYADEILVLAAYRLLSDVLGSF